MLGSDVIGSPGGDILEITKGTSFSAPLFVRYIINNFPKNTDPASIKDALKTRFKNKKFVPSGSYLERISFKPMK